MLRENESNFVESLEITTRGSINVKANEKNKQAVSKSDVKKIIKNFERSPDIQRNTLDMYKQRADIDDNSKQVAKDFFNDLSQARKNKKKMHICTAMSYRKAGIFKNAGRDVYEDLDTGDFWKISEDKKHVVRLFNEDEKGISDKKASKEEQVIPDGTKCIFKLKHLTPKEFDNFSDEKFIESLDNEKCTVDELATFTELGEKDFEYYNITFENGTKLEAVSGFHLEPINKKAAKDTLQIDFDVSEVGGEAFLGINEESLSTRVTIDLSKIAKQLEEKFGGVSGKTEILQGKENLIIFDLESKEVK